MTLAPPFSRIQQAAAKAIAQEDVWAKHNIPSLPAERIIRHLYNPVTQSWYTDETIVKIESKAFAHGAMRHCFRMKKLATPPKSATNHRFHSYGWSRASNYVAKAYMTPDNEVDCSEEVKAAVRNDIILQYEANHWANKFNETRPPKSIVFIRAYAIEFPNRPGSPWFPVERFIAGKDSYGVGFVKHNTNSGFVDTELHRTTPQVFSAFSFYASQGRRLVADIQGVGDLYTDPQVLSSDYRFGDGDLGPRGMALFFHTFRHCSYSDLLGIPVFPLSKNELKNQAKYNDDDLTLSDDEGDNDEGDIEGARRFSRLDQNRLRRKSVFILPTDAGIPIDQRATAKRSNINNTHQAIRKSIKISKQHAHPASLVRSKSDIDEVTHSLILATTDAVFDHKSFHRKASGALRERTSENRDKEEFRSDIVTAPPMIPTEVTKANLGKVHYQLACLHGMGRFPEMVEDDEDGVDVPSIVFHLSHAASLRNVAACLSLGRIRAGLDTSVSPVLRSAVTVDFESAKDLFQRAMDSSYSNAKAKAAAGCLLLQILEEEEDTTNVTLIGILEDTLAFMEKAEKEDQELKAHSSRMNRGGMHIGDRVEANYALEGTYYPGSVTNIDGDSVTVQYDDDGSSETHTGENVRPLIPMAATNDNGNPAGPLTDEEALGEENEDEKCILEAYALKAHLADLKAAMGNVKDAAALYEEAADGAMNAGKMKSAAEWSSKAAEVAAV